MLDRLGVSGGFAALVGIGALMAGIFQKSTFAIVVAIIALLYVVVKFFLPTRA